MMPSLHQLVVEEHYVLPDGLPADVQLIGGEVRVGIHSTRMFLPRPVLRELVDEAHYSAVDIGPCDHNTIYVMLYR
jgi:hypothetical protein